MTGFAALQLSRADGVQLVDRVHLDDDDLPPGDVTVVVDYSDLNYKDGLVMAPGSTIARRLPLVPGIDLAGVVTASDHPGHAPGNRVTVNGFGLGTHRDGGLAQRTRVPGDWLVRLPRQMTRGSRRR